MSAKSAVWLTGLSMYGLFFFAACLVRPFSEVLPQAVALTLLAGVLLLAVTLALVLVLAFVETALTALIALLQLLQKLSEDTQSTPDCGTR